MSQNGLLPFSAKIGNEEKGTLRYALVYAFQESAKGQQTLLQIAPSIDEANAPDALYAIDLPVSSVFQKANAAWRLEEAFVDLSDQTIALEKEKKKPGHTPA